MEGLPTPVKAAAGSTPAARTLERWAAPRPAGSILRALTTLPESTGTPGGGR